MRTFATLIAIAIASVVAGCGGQPYDGKLGKPSQAQMQRHNSGASVNQSAPPKLASVSTAQAPSTRYAAPLVAAPAPVPVPGQKDPFCKPGENCWKRVGANPYMGGPYPQNIDGYLKLSKAPQWAKDQWREQAHGNRGRSHSMADGALYHDQIYTVGGKHIMWYRVRQSVGRSLEGLLFEATSPEGKKEFLFLPLKDKGGCDNYSWVAEMR